MWNPMRTVQCETKRWSPSVELSSHKDEKRATRGSGATRPRSYLGSFGAIRSDSSRQPVRGSSVVCSARTPRPGRYATLHREDANRGRPLERKLLFRLRPNSRTVRRASCGHTWAQLMVSRTRSRKLQCHSYCRRRFASTEASARRGGSARPPGVGAHASTTLIWFPSQATR
jgi:hypothetical protein